MATKTKVTTAPFGPDGSLMHYPESRNDYTGAKRLESGYGWEIPPRFVGPDWRPNTPFQTTLRLDGTCRGRSAAYFVWKDDAECEFPMFISDMADLVKAGATVTAGVVTAWWMVAKKGANYGIRLATADEIAAISTETVEQQARD